MKIEVISRTGMEPQLLLGLVVKVHGLRKMHMLITNYQACIHHPTCW